MKRILRILKWAAISVAALTGVFVVIIQLIWDRKFDAPFPNVNVAADSVMIARGRYLAFGPAHCADCHAPGDLINEVLETGEVPLGYPPLSGGFTYSFEVGTLHFPNLTPDTATGIGRYSDRELARVLRHGVKPNGNALFPMMEYQNISDEDIIALISFLRSQEPVRNPVPPHELSFLGKMAMALLIRPVGPQGIPPLASPPEEATIARGEYLANRVAQCAQCHTKRSDMDFSLTGARLAGGNELVEQWAPDQIFVPPNLTPDRSTGHIVNWKKEQFVQRFRAGSLIPNSPMPWYAFGRMSDIDLAAIYQYLMSLEPVANQTGPLVRPRK